MSSSTLSPAPSFDLRRERTVASTHLRAALDGSSGGLLTFDDGQQILFRSNRLSSTLNIPRAVIEGAASLLELLEGSEALDDDSVQRIHELCLSVIAEAPEQRATITVADGSSARHFAVAVVRLSDGCAMASFEDVTAMREAERRAIESAMCDPLTGLPNRQLFKGRVTAAFESLARDRHAQAAATASAVMLVDLDRFKVVNDTLGHPIGDGLLRLVAKRLRSVVRPQDLVARLGGDEFAVLVSPAPERNRLDELARRIVNMLGRPYLVEGHLLTIGASVGLALAPTDATEHDQILRNADLALYEAKSSGRSQFVAFRPDMDVKALARRSLEVDLRRALALREFELFFQPQVDLESETVVGFEALLRWRHPERGLVSPADFIPLAEEIGLIVPIGDWVIRQACHQAVRWPDHISIAVNVSALQFEDPRRLIETIMGALAMSGLPGRRLEVEITESVLLRNENSVLDTLHQLRELGVRVAMDDFGTGYSSLSQLNSFPFDKIKIDRSFVRDQSDLDGQNAIIRAITALGVSLGMSTIAEGVETTDQLGRIRAGGCTSVQGYLFSKPVPIGEVERVIADFSGLSNSSITALR